MIRTLWLIVFLIFQNSSLSFGHGLPADSLVEGDVGFEWYRLKTKNCAFKIFASEGGQVLVDSWLEDRSLFSEKSDARGAALMPYFHCLKVSAHKYCPAAWTQSVLDTAPAMKAVIDVRRYDDFHPFYFSLAFAANTNATNPPRPRTLHFCLGTDFQVVEGVVSVGTEKSHKTLQALKILKMINLTRLTRDPD